jgi:hypothetical protein
MGEGQRAVPVEEGVPNRRHGSIMARSSVRRHVDP